MGLGELLIRERGLALYGAAKAQRLALKRFLAVFLAFCCCLFSMETITRQVPSSKVLLMKDCYTRVRFFPATVLAYYLFETISTSTVAAVSVTFEVVLPRIPAANCTIAPCLLAFIYIR